MLDRNDIQKYGPPGFHLAQKEKDYVQYWVLAFLSRSGFMGVFKGGTSLQKAFNLPRYSEDLDFNLNSGKVPDFDQIGSFLVSSGFSGISWKSSDSDISLSARMSYRGPLYNGSEISEGRILLEFSKREAVISEPIIRTLNPPYPDILPYQMRLMDPSEMACEKVRAMMTRFSARDLFDLYFLLRMDSIPSIGIINRKLSYYGKSFEYSAFKERVHSIERIWTKEMAALTPNPVDYGTAAFAVLAAMKKV